MAPFWRSGFLLLFTTHLWGFPTRREGIGRYKWHRFYGVFDPSSTWHLALYIIDSLQTNANFNEKSSQQNHIMLNWNQNNKAPTNRTWNGHGHKSNQIKQTSQTNKSNPKQTKQTKIPQVLLKNQLPIQFNSNIKHTTQHPKNPTPKPLFWSVRYCQRHHIWKTWPSGPRRLVHHHRRSPWYGGEGLLEGFPYDGASF